MKIQVIGLPGSGKTWAISQFLKTTYCPITKLDIRDYKDAQEFYRSCASFPSHLIIESACGILLERSLVIKLELPKEIWKSRLLSRDHKIDYSYIALLEQELMPGDILVRDSEALVVTLGKLFGSRNGTGSG